MGTIADKLAYTKKAKTDIKQSINNKGVPVSDTDPLGTYSEKINQIPTEGGGGTGGTTNYNQLSNKPKINNVELVGNKTATDLKLFDGNYNNLSNKPSIPTKTSQLTNDSNFVIDAQYKHIEIATSSKQGIVKPDGSTITIDTDGTIHSVGGGGGGGSYILPQASANTLGGIKAAPKTNKETVEIKIDNATGKLFSPTGLDGARGSMWYEGDKITGTSTAGTIFANSGITDSQIGDKYLNITTYNIYNCVLAGNTNKAKWAYIGCIKGKDGESGGGGGPSGFNGMKAVHLKGNNQTIAEMEPSTAYICDDAIQMFKVNKLKQAPDGYFGEYYFTFKAEPTGAIVQLPTNIYWDGGTQPAVEAWKTYECRISNDIARLSKGIIR